MSKAKEAKDKLQSTSLNFVNGDNESLISLSSTLCDSLSIVERVSEVVSVPLVGVVCSIISDIIYICESTKQNKKICSSIKDRAIVAKLCVEKLQSHQKLYEKRFRDPGYKEAFNKLSNVLNNILSFVKKVSDVSLFQKITNTISIKEKFNELIYEFDRSMGMLNLSITIDNSIQRDLDTENLNNDIAEMKTILKNFGGADYMFIQEIQKINHKIETNKFQGIKTIEIDPLELIKPNVGKASDRRGGNGFHRRFIIKKVLKGSDVACVSCYEKETENNEKKIYTYMDRFQAEYAKRFQAELTILEKLKDSTNILRFYGLSKLNEHRVMVFEWTEWGNLQEVYSNRKIDWNNKIHIALGICRGLACLHLASILHHDIRCRNIMMTPRLEPKIANFKYSSENDQMTTDYEQTAKVLRWMAPEKIRSTNERSIKYTYECEIFSFGMLLWELIFQKIPYNDLNIEEVKKTVLGGKRETFRFEKGSSELLKLQKKLKKIIENAWDNEPNVRNSSQTIFTKFVKLAKYCDDLDKKDPNNSSNSPSLDIQDLEEKIEKISFPYIKPFPEGVKSHNAKDYKTAWEIFECHANLGVPTAKYWKAYYYDHGYHVKRDLVKAANLYKELADDGFADASLRYSQMILTKEGGLQLDKNAFLMYLTKAADNGNYFAQYKLGDLLVKQGNKDIGVKYLKLAALSDNAKAIELLKKMKIDGFANASLSYSQTICTKEGSLKLDKNAHDKSEDGITDSNLSYSQTTCTKGSLQLDKNAYDESDYDFADAGLGYTQKICTKESSLQLYENELLMNMQQNNLGYCYLNRIVTTKDEDEKKFQWYMKFAEEGDSGGQYNIGNFYENGIGTIRDEEKAFQWYLKSAKGGNSNGQYNLGNCYENGIGTIRDEEKAFQWYLKSVKGGNSKGQDNLANCYENGIGTIRDEEQAFQWYLKSAKRGSSNGQCSLGKCYLKGMGTTKDEEKAFKWYLKSAGGGSIQGQYNLGVCNFYGIGTTKDEKKAFQWYMKSAEGGDKDGQKSLGYCYHHGIGTIKDEEKALHWYSISAERGNSDAQISLGNFEKTKVEEKIFHWNLKSAEEDNNLFNYIQFTKPQITINNRSNIWNDSYLSNFLSIESNIYLGTSAASHAKVENLINLLINKKNEIDKILELQPAYIIEPDFKEGSTVPHISCWVTKPLDISILEKLEKLFDDEFEVINCLLNEGIEEKEEKNCNGDNNNVENSEKQEARNEKKENGNERNDIKDKRTSKEKQNNNKKEKSNKNSDSDSNDSLHNELSETNGPILISSEVIAEVKDTDIIQDFKISAYLWAKVDPLPNKRNDLTFSIDVNDCRMGKMLSEQWESLHKLGIGYFLDSVEIRVTPIQNKSVSNKTLYTVKKIEIRESIQGVDASINKDPGINISFEKTYQHGLNYTAKEWKLNIDDGSETGLGWRYQYLADGLCKDFNDGRNFAPGNHFCHWLTFEAMSGFHITITQVLRCKITKGWRKHKLNTGSKLIQQYPKMAHTFKITFNSLENFNENFENLRNYEESRDRLNVTFAKNALSTENTKNSNIEDTSIERSATKAIATLI
ncbi:hypothetical protein Glove_116g34 [Diversispora epigaea]|uniref:Protein kinase domain-containing protein n=1 Tax=Diversispora epigaea TaxID=1348612 RepID=A0A397J7C1_9GLOM|nr:hypothetical protein Glove_116g34 [Diversispora epigaea]